jgi:hypothetical protein
MPGLSVQYRTQYFESGLNIDSRRQNGQKNKLFQILKSCMFSSLKSFLGVLNAFLIESLGPDPDSVNLGLRNIDDIPVPIKFNDLTKYRYRYP